MSVATLSAEVCERVRNASRAALYLDFDGTLTPIVERVEDAHLPEPVRDTLAALAIDPRFTIAIVSGRALSDLRRRVAIPGLVYAGNHGLEIAGLGLSFRASEAETLHLRAALNKLHDALRSVPGAQVEDKGLTASVHFRRVEPSRREEVQAIVRRIIPAGDPNLMLRDARMVTEIRPRLSWNKGEAVLWIRRELDLSSAVEICIGDDATDEDAFRVLPDAFTIHVGSVGETEARYRLQDPGEVAVLLKCILNDGSFR